MQNTHVDSHAKQLPVSYGAGPKWLSSSRGKLYDFWRRFRKNRTAVIGLLLIAFNVSVAILAPVLAPYDPYEQNWRARMEGPSAEHWFGTDQHGRDQLSRIIWGSRISLAIGMISVSIGLFGGGLLGLVAGFFGGFVDNTIMRIMDIMMAFPGVLMAMALVAALGPGLYNVMIAVGVWSIPLFSRLVRGTVLGLKENEFVAAARAIGCSSVRIIFFHVLPNTIAPILVFSSLRMATALLSAAALSFLGLGAQPPQPDWGAMLSQGRQHIHTSPHLMWFPGAAIMLLVLAFNMLGDGLRDALDPRLRNS